MDYSPLDSATTQLLPNRTITNHDNCPVLTRTTTLDWVLGHYHPTIAHQDHY